MQLQSSPSELPEKKIILSELPRARKMGTGEMITRKVELATILTNKGIPRATTIIRGIFKSDELSSPEDYILSKKGSPAEVLLISANGVDKLLLAINNRIQDLEIA